MDIGDTERIWEVEPITQAVEKPETHPALNENVAASTTPPSATKQAKEGT